MNVQLIVGRSGSGKTHHCLEAIKGELLRSAVGQALLFLVPEQATFQMEQALLADGKLGGYHRAKVVSFQRLAREVLWETGPPDREVLSEFGKQMVLRRLLQENREGLRIFQRAATRSGFIRQLSGMIRELRQYGQGPEDLRRQRERLLKGATPAAGRLADKLADLGLIYGAYQEYLAERFFDPDEYLDLAAARCGEVEFLRGGQLWVDGFAGFTPQQFGMLIALMRQAEQTAITFCLDPQSSQFQLACAQPGEEKQLDETDMFHPTLQTCGRLLALIEEDNARHKEAIQVTEPLILPAGETLPRFGKSEVLARLERRYPEQNRVRKGGGTG